MVAFAKGWRRLAPRLSALPIWGPVMMQCHPGCDFVNAGALRYRCGSLGMQIVAALLD
jgi:hypothetical protein